jgi:D-glycero-D-manno-heptose 1,7-bisphosphate phosphatase
MSQLVRGILFIDRDGTLIEERNYLSDPNDVELLPGAWEGLRAFKTAGFRLILLTNQSGVGRGFFTERRLEEIHDRLNALLAEHGVVLDNMLYCPHKPDDACSCRKPNTALAVRALAEYRNVPLPVIVIGDKECDIEMGKRLSATTVLVRTGYGEWELGRGRVAADYVANDILDAARTLGLCF